MPELNQKDKQKENKEEEQESFLSFVFSLVFLIFLVFICKYSILDASTIPSGSMIPSLRIGDYLFLNKMRYSLRMPFVGTELWRIDDPKRGEIITFVPPGGSIKTPYVKRAMALPGDLIRLRFIKACQLKKELYKMKRNFQPSREKAYTCNFSDKNQPTITLFEYKAGNTGEWQSYLKREVPTAEIKKMMEDADSLDVLDPNVIPEIYFYFRHPLPVLYEEEVQGESHFILETSNEGQ